MIGGEDERRADGVTEQGQGPYGHLPHQPQWTSPPLPHASATAGNAQSHGFGFQPMFDVDGMSTRVSRLGGELCLSGACTMVWLTSAYQCNMKTEHRYLKSGCWMCNMNLELYLNLFISKHHPYYNNILFIIYLTISCLQCIVSHSQ